MGLERRNGIVLVGVSQQATPGYWLRAYREGRAVPTPAGTHDLSDTG